MTAVPSRVANLRAIEWTITPVVLIVVICRLYIRVIRKKNAGWDDAAAAVAAALNLTTTIQQTIMTNYGFAKHLKDITPVSRLQWLSAWIWAVDLQFFAGFFFARLSVQLFLFRLIAGAKTWTRWLVWFAVVLNALTFIITVVCFCALCIPIEAFWDKNIKGDCLPPDAQAEIVKVTGVLAFINDCVCATMPIFVVRKLKLQREKKLAIIVVLGLGYIVAACTLVRTILANNVYTDPFWQLIPVTYFGELELGLGIIIASIPALSPLFIRSWQLLSSKRSARNLLHNTSNETIDDGEGSSATVGSEDWDVQIKSESEIRLQELLPHNVILKSIDLTVEESVTEARDTKTDIHRF